MKILIATACKPKNGISVQTLFDQIVEAALLDFSCVVTKAIWCHGPGCTNLAFEIFGLKDDREKFANQLTMAFMPAKWSTTKDHIPEGFTDQLSN